MIPSFSFDNMNFSLAEGKYIGTLNFSHAKAQKGSSGDYNRLEGSVKVNNQEKVHPIDIIFVSSRSGAGIMIVGTNSIDKKRLRLNITPKIGIGIKLKIDGYYDSHPISVTTDVGIDAISKVLETLISFVV